LQNKALEIPSLDKSTIHWKFMIDCVSMKFEQLNKKYKTSQFLPYYA